MTQSLAEKKYENELDENQGEMIKLCVAPVLKNLCDLNRKVGDGFLISCKV